MIFQFWIFDRGGTILFSERMQPWTGNPLDSLVRAVLLEDRAAMSNYSYKEYLMEWKLANEHGLVFVVLYSRHFPANYGQGLLESVRGEFLKQFGEAVKSGNADQIDASTFSNSFKTIWNKEESSARAKPAPPKPSTQTTSRSAPKQASVVPKQEPQKDPELDREQSLEDEFFVSPEEVAASAATAPAVALTPEQLKAKILARQNLKKRGGKESAAPEPEPAADSKKEKVARVPMTTKVTKQTMAEFDWSADSAAQESIDEAELQRTRAQFLEAKPSNYTLIPAEQDEGKINESEIIQESRMMSFFKGLAGTKEMTKEDLEPALKKLQDQLISKNVAYAIASQLCDSVATSLEGKKPGSFTTVATMVKNAVTESLTRLLTPKQSVDILSQAKYVKKMEKRPFVIVYCGVNGVGKSTSLAKTCFYLQQHGLKVHLAACDTFRSGAVEQLRTHARCLNATLHEQGYNKDAASVASYAIATASKAGADVVLVDTAGRMQDNEPLMRSLSKLVSVNKPDRIFFVGEALVGNDAVDQLTKFDKAISAYAPPGAPHRRVDGIVLTKFDTIDDKVGAAVSMVYSTGQPIVFVGVGQTYMDLRKVNTNDLVTALLR